MQRARASCLALCFAAALLLGLRAAEAQPPPQKFRVYPSFEGADAEAPLPDDYEVPAEFVVGRLMYPGGGRGFFGGNNYKRGGTSWTDDYPRGDRTFVQMLRRFTRTNVRGVEQPIDLDDGDVDYWPFMVVGLAQAWQLSDEQAATLREYLLRGGFLFCDSFFGGNNWSVFEESLKRVFPDLPIVDLTDDHPIFHTVFDLPHMTTVQIPNWNSLERGGPGYLGYDGKVPRWRGVIGEDGRLMMLIAYNNDVMDGWQWADDPRYPAEEANLALRLGVNVAMYAMTH